MKSFNCRVPGNKKRLLCYQSRVQSRKPDEKNKSSAEISQVVHSAPQNVIKHWATKVDQSLVWGEGDGGFGQSREKVIERWLQVGQDPVLDAPVTLTSKEMAKRRNMLREDILGTDLASPDEEHHRQSKNFYRRIFKERALLEMRQYSKAPSDVGKLSFGPGEKLPAVDPADLEATRWENCPTFQQMAQSAEMLFGTRPRHMKDFELLLENAEPEKLYLFWSNIRPSYGNQPHTNLSLSAFGYYDGLELKDFCYRIKPRNDARRDFVTRLISDIEKATGWSFVAERIASVYEDVYEVFNQRTIRRINSGKQKVWTMMSAEEQFRQCLSERDREERRVLDGTFDPPDSTDFTEAWKKEHEAIESIFKKKIPRCSFSLKEYWEDYERVNEMQREHMYTTYDQKIKFARCWQRLRDEVEGSDESIWKAVTESLRKSTFDSGSGTVIPFMNSIWCKLNWSFFGSNYFCHHTDNGKREYVFQHGTPTQVRALARAYYRSKTYGENIDYSSPYTYRQSHAALIAEAGVESMSDSTRESKSMVMMVDWEEDLATVVRCSRNRLGKVRRRYDEKARDTFAASPESGGPITNTRLTSGESKNILSIWRTGTKSVLHYHWKPVEFDEPLPPPGKTRVLAEFERRKKAVFEISLWKKKNKTDLAKESKAIEEAEELCKKDSKMRDVSWYTLWFYQNVVNRPWCYDVNSSYLYDSSLMFIDKNLENKSVNSRPTFFLDECSLPDDTEHLNWTFTTMLHDNVELQGTEMSVPLVLPFLTHGIGSVKHPLEDEIYRVRIRGYRNTINSRRHPARCVQTYTQPFVIQSCLEDELKTYLKDKLVENEFFPASCLPELVTHLRTLNYAISIDQEFELGQRVTIAKEISIKYIKETLSSGLSTEDPNNQGLSEDEVETEKALYRIEELIHPGLSQDEFLSQRRAIFMNAFEKNEAAWWVYDELEQEHLSLRNLNAPVWYIHDKLISLSARGNYEKTPGVTLATAEMDGSGVLTDLRFENLDPTNPLPLQDALRALQGAIHNAHTRLNFLAHSKLAPVHEKIRRILQDRQHSPLGFVSWGGEISTNDRFLLSNSVKEFRT